MNVEDSQREQFIGFMAMGELGPVLIELGMTPAQLAQAVRKRLESYAEIDTNDLRPAEFRQFVEDPGDRIDSDLEFEIRREPVPESVKPWVANVVRAVRLREVRALTGFTRINPPGDPDGSDHASLSATRLNWLPAIEVRGEGIFIALNETQLARWEALRAVRERADRLNALYVADWEARHGANDPPTREVTARFLLCHTLAHALMRQLTLECGYSSAALQERIYAAQGDRPMAGVLVYTATTDSDGTLGGLQRQGKSNRIGGILARAVAAIEWCSSDPLCISDMMGAGASFSGAACHSCVLAPETSCETFNAFLDRALLIGTSEDTYMGFFSGILRDGD